MLFIHGLYDLKLYFLCYIFYVNCRFDWNKFSKSLSQEHLKIIELMGKEKKAVTPTPGEQEGKCKGGKLTWLIPFLAKWSNTDHTELWRPLTWISGETWVRNVFYICSINLCHASFLEYQLWICHLAVFMNIVFIIDVASCFSIFLCQSSYHCEEYKGRVLILFFI